MPATSYRHLCRPCHSWEKAKSLGKHVCQWCHLVIEEQPLMFRSDPYHPDHFSCTHCRYQAQWAGAGGGMGAWGRESPCSGHEEAGPQKGLTAGNQR